MKKTKVIASVVSTIISSSVTAADTDEIIPVVLTPSRMTQSIADSPSAVTVIDRNTIQATGARKLLDVLRLVPGMTVGSAYGNLQVPAFHGMGDNFSRRIQVLVDGRSAWQPITGGVAWLNMPVPLEAIDRIEVIRGPNTATYGSSAFFATINIITNHTSETTGTTMSGTTGGEGIRDLYAQHGGTEGRFGYSFSVSRQEDDGYEALNDSRRDDVAFVRFDFAADERNDFMLQMGASDSTYGAGAGDFYSPFREIGQTDNFQTLQWLRATSPGSDLKFTVSRHYFENDHSHLVGPIPSPPVGNLVLDYSYKGERLDAEFQHSKLLTEKLRIVWGAGIREDRVEAPFYFDTEETQKNKNVRGFLQAEYRITDSVIANVGAMYEDSDLVDPETSPRAALIFHPVDGHTIRLGYSVGTRQAMLYEELSRQYVPNEADTFRLYKTYASGGLNPEKITSKEVGYRYDTSLVSIDARLYQDDVKDLITQFLAPAPAGTLGYYNSYTSVLDFKNEDAVTIKGLELETEFRPSVADKVRFIYANTQIYVDTTTAYLDYATSAPRHQIGLLYSHDFGGGWNGSTFYTWQDGMQWLATDPIESYERLDVRLARETQIDGKRLTVELVGQGITGRYADYKPDANWSPVYYARVKLAI